MNFRRGQVVYLVGHRGVGIDPQCPLDLRQDRAEMGHGNDMGIGVSGVYSVDCRVDPRRCLVPAFAIRGDNVAWGLSLIHI